MSTVPPVPKSYFIEENFLKAYSLENKANRRKLSTEQEKLKFKERSVVTDTHTSQDRRNTFK